MSESCRENLPLLFDDYSDEELHIRKSAPKFHHQFRYTATSGRARTQAKGAAAIIAHWPDHSSSLLSYWWVGLSMIAFIIFVMYNSIVAFSMLPSTHIKPLRYLNTEHKTEISHEDSKINLFMHILITNYDEQNINNYLSYINILANKHSNLKYNLIVVLKNESNDYLNNISDELNNELALNSLWVKNDKLDKTKLYKNVNIQIISLSNYMDQSPLKKYWRHLPPQFFGFLMRCIAIWDKGGIAFDPIILTPNSPNSNYLESLEHIISNLQLNTYKRQETTQKKPLNKNTLKRTRKKNNIQDIIDDLENQDKYSIQGNLLEAESKNNLKIQKLKRNKIKRNTKRILEDSNNIIEDSTNNINNIRKMMPKKLEETRTGIKIYKNLVELDKENGFEYLSTTDVIKNKNQFNYELTTKRDLLPLFLKYLFHKPQNMTHYTKERDNTLSDVPLSANNTNSSLNDIVRDSQQNNSIMTDLITRNKLLKVKTIDTNISSSEKETNTSLSIDLKGNLIATETPCHALIGTIFSNVVHHSDDEVITDFIITELSIFCKGVLSSCKGIDLILL